ncbi:type II toxin-antitoxin system CcdA family antitoxin [Spongiactinospora sp. TRM90649]|uniref:type II toxin-antitoxin system CcdA family antitoxin n=1 Tax=Spongiactinospora sp. TRM90649 TaxID=3031114 RepID=UPI0023F88D96|nr:type II toxin-antitoxin system CcdA family antitoxin [Spongiactinospora sp. TRM90649]MDF5755163.1 type II toxin-antitoxin system CcdA family antitoxin [Spongiactinospora sp. TRM90649]
MAAKDTISVTLDHELVEYARTQTGSLSAYVNQALADKVREDRRLRAIVHAHRDRAHKNADHALVERRMAHVAQQLAGLSGEAAQ